MAVYNIENAEKWHEKFDHPWFFESTYRKLMEDYSEEFVHIRSLKTGIIFQFRLYYYTHYGFDPEHKPNCILITSTNQDTFFLPQHGDFSRALRRVVKAGTPVYSKTSHNNKVCFGERFSDCWAHLQTTLNACDMVITPKAVKMIWDELQLRQLAKQGEKILEERELKRQMRRSCHENQ